MQDPAAVLVALRSAQGPRLPEPKTIGAALRSEPASYTRETLYEYVDGAAESYLARGFERCLAASYTFDGAAGASLEVEAEVYRFATADGARAQLESERPVSASPVAGMAGSWADTTTLVATRGRDYLKLTALAEGDSRRTLVALAAGWEKGLPR